MTNNEQIFIEPLDPNYMAWYSSLFKLSNNVGTAFSKSNRISAIKAGQILQKHTTIVKVISTIQQAVSTTMFIRYSNDVAIVFTNVTHRRVIKETAKEKKFHITRPQTKLQTPYWNYIKFFFKPNSIGHDTVKRIIQDFNNNPLPIEKIKEDEDSSVYQLVDNYGTLSLKDFRFDGRTFKPKAIINNNYNETFIKLYPKWMNQLKEKRAGLHLFTGPPGTGKSSLIMHLMSKQLGKKVILLNTDLLHDLGSYSFTSFVYTSLKDSICIIEDAELLIHKRDDGSNPIIPLLLNMTSGILGELLKTQIILTVNTEENIDTALLRKGRLLFKYNFKALEIEKAQELANHLKLDTVVKEPMTLADIYNLKVVNNHTESNRRKLGF